MTEVVATKVLSKQEEFIARTGKPIIINGKTYLSVRSAADFIHKDQEEQGKVRKQQTIRTELRKISKGVSGTRLMYGEYNIEVLTDTKF